ncbi:MULTISPECIES: YbfB/YjiJ family MFS transporter [unclassified Halomonas]|uniref:YbfB/YjiJ family MFS transporter n=1 Tax=unclassified Halomonas TaxID=2609666 RepID=UPI0028857DD4|nr:MULTISPECIES: YbfB/YjiJ family MFS transporter [unclassified Halomonas]MDT0499987.1 YbfB/YjiJ family MFS transporter [Halomonas sp. PAR7]MDT0512391.1 YbfB/YjiJ family MFS transporter [Halomonas sp. LES1]MDT0591025.1 YbfB/YjiJ family MFS transporter [Halomonas sp. PAR8]
MAKPFLLLPRYRVLLAGLFSQLLCVGVARFAYTPLLPVMQQQTWLSDAQGGWLAALNYAGYMLGALTAASISSIRLKDTLYRLTLVLALLSTAGMALADSFWLWATMRLVAGFSSSGAMLLASGLILHWLISHRQRGELGIHFAGVGLGMLLAALTVELMLRLSFDWQAQWWGFAALAVALLIPAWCWLPRPAKPASGSGGEQRRVQPPSRTFMRLMLAAYFCAGYGYVISATFIVAIVEREPLLAGAGNWTFALVGLAAAPAVMLWDLIARWIGYLGALIAAMGLQVVGIVLPAVTDNLAGVLASALLYGGTFLGCVSLVLTMAGRLYPQSPARMMGRMTLAYGAAQIIAPALTGMLAEATGHYDTGLWLAGGFVALGAVLLVWLRGVDQTAQRLDAEAKAVA